MKDKIKFTDILLIILMFLMILIINFGIVAIIVKVFSWAFGFRFKWRYVVAGIVILFILKDICNVHHKDN